MSKHTPGPWSSSMAHKQFKAAVHGPEGDAIAVCDGVRLGAQNDANARLIAAAPELLQFAMNFIEDSMMHSNLIAQAQQAIAKAEGGK
jgi:hypothetical protein